MSAAQNTVSVFAGLALIVGLGWAVRTVRRIRTRRALLDRIRY